jgi:hypothetical protein
MAPELIGFKNKTIEKGFFHQGHPQQQTGNKKSI